MDLENLFLLRQSTRDYSEKKVNDEDLKEICRLAAFAPSAINQQPYNLYAMKGEKTKSFTKNIQSKIVYKVHTKRQHELLGGQRSRLYYNRSA